MSQRKRRKCVYRKHHQFLPGAKPSWKVRPGWCAWHLPALAWPWSFLAQWCWDSLFLPLLSPPSTEHLIPGLATPLSQSQTTAQQTVSPQPRYWPPRAQAARSWEHPPAWQPAAQGTWKASFPTHLLRQFLSRTLRRFSSARWCWFDVSSVHLESCRAPAVRARRSQQSSSNSAFPGLPLSL